MTSAAVLVPSKFIIIITHLLVCLVIMQTKEGNIYASLPNNIDPPLREIRVRGSIDSDSNYTDTFVHRYGDLYPVHGMDNVL